jgi:hypothetical protein
MVPTLEEAPQIRRASCLLIIFSGAPLALIVTEGSEADGEEEVDTPFTWRTPKASHALRATSTATGKVAA